MDEQVKDELTKEQKLVEEASASRRVAMFHTIEPLEPERSEADLLGLQDAEKDRRSAKPKSSAGTRRKKGHKKRRGRKRRRRLSRRGKIIITGMVLALIAIFIALVLLVSAAVRGIGRLVTHAKSGSAAVERTLEAESEAGTEAETEAVIWPEESDDITSFQPTCTPDTDPKKWISSTDILVNGEEPAGGVYSSDVQISFEEGSKYTEMDGVITFRGNNFRTGPAYGLANMTENKLELIWSQETDSTEYNGKVWNGSGWTGQPLITSWPKDVRSHMNMYDWAKDAEELTEVIYATLDGNVYFLELETGKPTRDPLDIGFTFKGSGALDPRGYPILYLGAGYTSNQGKARVFIVNLLDCSIMYTFGDNDPFALRNCSFFDSSALVDAETDTLIYPGESGILYLMHLNTKYDKTAGTLSIDPDRVVKWNYEGLRSSSDSYWLGMEDSAVIYQGYLFIADNGGHLMCLDLNTLKLVWVQDTWDDTNGSPVLSVEDGHPYLYIGPSFHGGWRASYEAEIPLFKIDAENGSVVWTNSYTCTTEEGVSGGIQSTVALGQKQLGDYVYCTVSRVGEDSARGVLACIDKKTGQTVWEHNAYYAWSSPICVYNEDGSGRVIYSDSMGTMYLLDGLSGDVLDSISLSDGVIEASPAAYNDMVVQGIRDSKIWGVKLK